jgi:hypothetical protein
VRTGKGERTLAAAGLGAAQQAAAPTSTGGQSKAQSMAPSPDMPDGALVHHNLAAFATWLLAQPTKLVAHA